MSVINLLDKCREVCSLASDNALAGRLGVSRAAVSRWRLGLAAPDAVSCAKIATITGEPLSRVLGIAGEARAISRDEKAVWRRLATAAAVLLAVGFSAAPLPSYARSGIAEPGEAICIMRNAASWLHRALSTLRAICRAVLGDWNDAPSTDGCRQLAAVAA
jgi:transcriptional regulator with XRE-family HTH domain